MSDRERETVNEIKKILFEREKGIGQFARTHPEHQDKVALEQVARKMLHHIDEKASISTDHSVPPEEPTERADVHSFMGKIGGTPVRMTFKLAEGTFSPGVLESMIGVSSSIKVEHPQSSGAEEEYESPYEDAYNEVLEEAKDIFIDRNKIYKDTFVALGLNGTVMTLIGDVFRLRNMITHDPDHGRGKENQIRDKLIDVINQAVISVMMLDEENYEGE